MSPSRVSVRAAAASAWRRAKRLRRRGPAAFVPTFEAVPAGTSDSPWHRLVRNPEALEAGASAERLPGPWIDGAVDLTARWQSRGLDIYANQGPRLDAAFPWDDLPPGPGGDSLYRVRPHRMAFASRFALASFSRPDAAGALDAILDGWMQRVSATACRPAYHSTLLVLQRMLSLTLTGMLLELAFKDRGRPPAVCTRIARIVDADARYLVPRIGDAFPNNHLLGDAFAGWLLGRIAPERLPSQDWAGRFTALFRNEIARQVHPDGTSFEHSLHYHELVLEMLAFYLAVEGSADEHADAVIKTRLEAMLRFQSEIRWDALGPGFGNVIEDPLLPLDNLLAAAPAAWRTLSLLWCQHRDPDWRDAPVSAERGFWLHALAAANGGVGQGIPAPCEEAGEDTVTTVFTDGGFVVFDSPVPTSQLVFRTGPHPGTEPCAGHMHADLLGICWAVAGHPVVVDAGTFSYRRGSEGAHHWREYFAGPGGHSVPSIGAQDPLGTLSRDFRPRSTATRARTEAGGTGALAFAHAVLSCDSPSDGLARSVIAVAGSYLLVIDSFPEGAEGQGAASVFQFAPGFEPESADAILRGRVGEETVAIVSLPDTTPELAQGREAPVAGWVAPRYGEKVPAWRARFPLPGDGDGISAFVLGTGAAVEKCKLAGAFRSAHGVSATIQREGHTEVALVATNPAGPLTAAIGACALELRGRCAFVRSSAEGEFEIRAVRATEVRVGPWRIRARSGTAHSFALTLPRDAEAHAEELVISQA